MGDFVSIVMPTFNGAKYIQAQIDSLINQSYQNYELIIIDDCSSDGTKEIIQGYLNEDKRIRFYENNYNIGINKNFEKGITLARGDVVFICDQDDIWDENKIETMLAYLYKGYDLVYCNLRVINSEGSIISKSFHGLIGTDNLYPKSLSKYLLFRNVTNGCSLCFKRQIVNSICPFPPNIIYDWWIMINSSLKFKVGYVKYPLMSYRIHDDNAVGVSTGPKSDQQIVTQIKQSIDRIRFLQEKVDNTCLQKSICTLMDYHNSRLQIYLTKRNRLSYCYYFIITLAGFPRAYKNLIKNFLLDTMPSWHTVLLNIWLRSKSKNSG